MKMCFLLLCCGITSVACAQNQHLTPGVGYYTLRGHERAYHKLLQETLYAGLSEEPAVRVLVLPSFSPEYLVSLEHHHLEYYLVVRTGSKSVWESLRAKADKEDLLPVREKRKEIDAAIGQNLHDCLFLLVSQAHYPPIGYIARPGKKPEMTFPIGVDGIRYHFVAATADSDVRSGTLYSPARGSAMGGLVDLIALLADIANGSKPEKELIPAISRLRKRTGIKEVSIKRPG